MSYDYGGEMGLDQGGAMPKRARAFLNDLQDIDKADHKDLYHMVLNFTPGEWEAVRESAHQLMGGAASPMWGGIDIPVGGAAFIGGAEEPTYSDLKDVLMTPSRGGAARLLELEHDARGSGFKKAIKKASKHASKFFKQGKKHLSTINEISKEIGDMGGPIGDYAKAVHSVTNPGMENINRAEHIAKAVKNAKPSDMGNTRENIKTGVQLANAALTGNSAKERATNVKNVAQQKFNEMAEKKGSGMDTGGGEDIGGAEEIGGSQFIGGASGIAGAMDIGGAMEVGAGNMEAGGKKGKKKKGGLAKQRKLTHPKKNKRAKSPEPLPLERASKDVQEAIAVDHHKGRKFHDPRKHR